MQTRLLHIIPLLVVLVLCLIFPLSGNGIPAGCSRAELPIRELLRDEVTLHEFYVGLTDIVYNPESRTYEITLKVFTDDLELAIERASGTKVSLEQSELSTAHDALVFAYVESTFAVKAKNGQPLTLKRIGRETEQDVTWIYLESAPMQPLKTAVVSNTMMMEIYSTQSHVVHITQQGSTRSALLHKTRTNATFSL